MGFIKPSQPELEHYSDMITEGILKDSKACSARAWELVDAGYIDVAGNILDKK